MRVSYYDVLGIPQSADEEKIRARYLILMRRYHPDVNRSPFANSRAAQIGEAFRALIDPATRARHDADLAQDRLEAVSARAVGLSRRALVVRRPRPMLRRYGARLVLLALVAGTLAAGWRIEQRLSGDAQPVLVASDDDDDRDSEARRAVAELNAATAREAQAMPPVSRAAVTAAATAFRRIAAGGDPAQAQAFSERCHAKVADDATWEALDFCVAFDQAAFIRQGRGDAPDAPYFVDRHDRAAHLYVARLSSLDAIGERLDRIRSQIAPPAPARTPTARVLHGIAKRGGRLADAVGGFFSPDRAEPRPSAGHASDF